MSDKGKKVFVIFGRNKKARDMLYEFIRSLGLEPIEWSAALSFSNEGSPFIGNIVDAAFENAQALIVLMTGDEIVKLQQHYDSKSVYEFQSRPNVIFEAGMAFGKNASKTIIVQIGKHRSISDLSGRHIVYLDNTIEKRLELIEKLKNAGCSFEIYGKSEWADLEKYKFANTIEATDIPTELVINNFYESRSFGQNFETILSMSNNSLTIMGIKFGIIMQQLDLVVDRLKRDKNFTVKFFLLSPIDNFGNELPWIDEVEKFNSFGNLAEILKINIVNLRKFKKSIKDSSVRSRITIKFYYTLPTASMIFYDKDSDNGMVRVEPYLYKMIPIQRASFDLKRKRSPKLYERYVQTINSIEKDCSINLEDKLFTEYLKSC